jgi:Mrp family chromosome partitioning ATPase
LNRVPSRNGRRNGGAILAFTSANPGEGVSHVVQFFAEKLSSQTGKPTLVVNAQRLRGLEIRDLLNLPGMRTKGDNVWSVPDEPPGKNNGHGNGTDIPLDHNKLRGPESETGLELLQVLGANFDYTLIDCPSISASYEAVMLAPEVDGVVLVVEADRTKRDQIFRARQTIEMAQGKLMGLVLNRRRHVVPYWFYRKL